MKVLTAYIRQHKRAVAFYFIAMAVFFILLFFYRLPVAAWAYGAVLCLAFGLILAVPDYLKFRKKHQELYRLEGQQEITDTGRTSGTGLSGADRRPSGKREGYPG